MKFVTFHPLGAASTAPRLGLLDGDAVVELPGDLPGLIAQGAAALDAIDRHGPRHGLDAVQLLAPIPRPGRNIFCVGKNYREHAREFHDSGFDASAGTEAVPSHPILFTKASNTVIGPGAPIPAYLDPTASVDYEGELAVVIGVGGRGISRADAMAHVFGYTIVNDVTSRTMQNRHKQWFLGKSIDGFCPMGPAVATPDEMGDLAAARLRTWVNGELRQDARIGQLIFDIPTLIATLSATLTLEPGDIVATGTCAGVGIGFTPPRYLTAGDRVRIAIDGLGELENPVA